MYFLRTKGGAFNITTVPVNYVRGHRVPCADRRIDVCVCVCVCVVYLHKIPNSLNYSRRKRGKFVHVGISHTNVKLAGLLLAIVAGYSVFQFLTFSCVIWLIESQCLRLMQKNLINNRQNCCNEALSSCLRICSYFCG